MKKLSVALVSVVAIALSVHAGDTVTSVNVVGYMTADIAGGSSDTYSLLSVPMAKVPSVRGTVSANTATTVTDGNASWTVDQFARNAANQEATGTSTFYVEVTSGTLAGRHYYIESNTGTALTINDPGDLHTGDLVGQSYKIVAANRVRDIFGEPGGTTVLHGEANENDADTVTVWLGTAWSGPIYYNTNVSQWVQLTQTGPALANDLVIDRDEGFMVKRAAGQALTSFTTAGEVSGTQQAVVLGAGFNLVGGMSAVDVELQDSGLATALASGGNETDADTIYEWKGAGWSGDIYNNSTVSHWVELTQAGPILADEKLLSAGKGVMINNKGGSSATWVRESPLQ